MIQIRNTFLKAKPSTETEHLATQVTDIEEANFKTVIRRGHFRI
ncbi:hypothetical protein SAMN04488244_105254 [Vibrio hangzhouensis]|uniref:Uncharacterized protein n=1 Tax=Vibrio hangzhouensis TaxID=462991 RepID=A0A1H5WHI5_9VIBR|nr:hypothetical protein SAMN04488244_105254 [Vibrio hangzhouensis]